MATSEATGSKNVLIDSKYLSLFLFVFGLPLQIYLLTLWLYRFDIYQGLPTTSVFLPMPMVLIMGLFGIPGIVVGSLNMLRHGFDPIAILGVVAHIQWVLCTISGAIGFYFTYQV